MTIELLFLIHFAAAWFMTGLIWFVQIVHYPLFLQISADDRTAYCLQHARSTSRVVLPVMAVELLTAALLAYLLPNGFWIMNLLLLLVIWASTLFIQVPLHQALTNIGSEEAALRLVRTNWLRTLLWTLRALLLACLISAG